MKNTISPFYSFDLYPIPPDADWANFSSGSNQRGLLIVFTINGENPTEAELDFLKKIIAAAQWDLLRDAKIIWLPPVLTGKVRFARLNSLDSFSRVLIFGLSPQELGIRARVQRYRPTAFQEKLFLFAESLEEINANKEKKVQLWTAMKILFGLT